MTEAQPRSHDEMQNLIWGGLHKPRKSLLRFAHASHKHHGLQGAIVEPHVEPNNGAPRLHEAEAHEVTNRHASAQTEVDAQEITRWRASATFVSRGAGGNKVARLG